MRRLAALFLLIVPGCAPQDMVARTDQARFATYPTTLFAAVESACKDPAETFVRAGRDVVQCRILLPPEPTAAILLRYDGIPEDLPQLVIEFSATRDGTGYLVANQTYLSVPQKSGAPLRVSRPDAQLSRMIDALYTKAGGTPV